MTLLPIYDRDKQRHAPPFPFVYKLLMLYELVGGRATTRGLETSEVPFFGEHELPDLSLSTSLPEIRRAFEHLRNPQWPPDLD